MGALQSFGSRLEALESKPAAPVFAQQEGQLPRPIDPKEVFAKLKGQKDTLVQETFNYDPAEEVGIRQRFSPNQIVEIQKERDLVMYREMGCLDEDEKCVGIISGFLHRHHVTGEAKYKVEFPENYGGSRSYFESDMVEYAA